VLSSSVWVSSSLDAAMTEDLVVERAQAELAEAELVAEAGQQA
jgi:hypothetical protein